MHGCSRTRACQSKKACWDSALILLMRDHPCVPKIWPVMCKSFQGLPVKKEQSIFASKEPVLDKTCIGVQMVAMGEDLRLVFQRRGAEDDDPACFANAKAGVDFLAYYCACIQDGGPISCRTLNVDVQAAALLPLKYKLGGDLQVQVSGWKGKERKGLHSKFLVAYGYTGCNI
eukprot:1145555-Pelagomonas_calceolata.AAC.1